MNERGLPHVEALEPRCLLSVAFQTPRTVANGIPTAWIDLSVLVTDMNQDGLADLVAGYSQYDGGWQYGLEVRLSNGDGTFARVPASFSGSEFGLGALGDFDGDGDIDAIVGGSLALNDGSGMLTQQPVDALLPAGGTFAALDANGDGRWELATKSGTTLRLLRLAGNAFTELSSVEMDARLSLDRAASVVDLTGDGRPDLVLRTDPIDAFSLLVFNESGALTVGPQLTGRAALADATGDGIADLFGFVDSPTVQGTAVQLSPGRGNGEFGPAESRGLVPLTEGSFSLTADLNGDGIPDLLFRHNGLNSGTPFDSVALSDTRGWYASGITYTGFGRDSRFYQTAVVGAGDFDGNGLLDLWGTESFNPFGGTGIVVADQAFGASLTSFTVSRPSIRPLDTVTLAAAVDPGTVISAQFPYVTFFIDQDGDGLVSAGDTQIGRVLTPDSDGLFRLQYQHLGVVPVGSATLLATASRGATSSPPLAAPVTFWTRLYFPEGFRNDETVNEYLSLVNPLDRAVRYEIIARYETGDRDQVIAIGELAAFSRGGVTICERGMPDSGLTRPGVGYALELRSDGPLGATFAHYDSTFSLSAGPLASGGAGEALTPNASTRWAYADLSTATFDFLLFYNISDQDASVQIRFYDDNQGSLLYNMTIPALRRGGVAIRDVADLVPGQAYAAVVTSTTELSAAHSRYRADGRAWSAAAAAVVDSQLFPGLEFQPGSVTTLSLFNADSAAVEITLTTAYDVGNSNTRSILVLPRQRLSIDPLAAAPAGATAASVRLSGMLGTSSDDDLAVLVALSVDDASRGDLLSSAPAATSRSVWAFGDAFLARDSAGLSEFESLFIYNATDAQQRVSVLFLFTDGTFADLALDVRARAPARLALQDQSVITDHAPNTWYGIMVHGEGAIVASLTHWDLTQGGGWSTLGTPQGSVGAV